MEVNAKYARWISLSSNVKAIHPLYYSLDGHIPNSLQVLYGKTASQVTPKQWRSIAILEQSTLKYAERPDLYVQGTIIELDRMKREALLESQYLEYTTVIKVVAVNNADLPSFSASFRGAFGGKSTVLILDMWAIPEEPPYELKLPFIKGSSLVQ